MQHRSVVVRRHAIFKRQYRRVVAALADFHRLPSAAQWTLLRAQVVAETVTGESALLETFDKRASRRDEVLARLEDGRQRDLATHAQRRS
jgi:hypothetical protein